MKTIFDKTTRDGLINRIQTLDAHSTAQWGKMNAFQMVKHCILFDGMITGKTQHKRVFFGRLIGRIALKNVVKNDNPMARNVPSGEEFKPKETHGNIVLEKNNWIALIEDYDSFSNLDLAHPFFGKMTKEQIGYFVYKHTDHHLRQFNA